MKKLLLLLKLMLVLGVSGLSDVAVLHWLECKHRKTAI